jgi:hypothetical protein
MAEFITLEIDDDGCGRFELPLDVTDEERIHTKLSDTR